MHKQEDCHHMAKERIGILGGTFDPIHDGHIHMALSAMQGAHLDCVLVLPTGNPPHKIGITPRKIAGAWSAAPVRCMTG